MDTRKPPEELTTQRAERIAELEMLGLAVNIIEPEIFGDGVIEISDLSTNLCLPQHLSWQKENENLSELSKQFIRDVRNLCRDFDGIVIRRHNTIAKDVIRHLFNPIYSESGYEYVYTQHPHQDGFNTDEFVILHNYSQAEREMQTYIMRSEDSRQALEIAIRRTWHKIITESGLSDFGIEISNNPGFLCNPQTVSRVLPRAFADSQSLSGQEKEVMFGYGNIVRESDRKAYDKAENDVIEAVKHIKITYGPYDTVIINQKGPLKLEHGAIVEGGDAKFRPEHQILRITFEPD